MITGSGINRIEIQEHINVKHHVCVFKGEAQVKLCRHLILYYMDVPGSLKVKMVTTAMPPREFVLLRY